MLFLCKNKFTTTIAVLFVSFNLFAKSPSCMMVTAKRLGEPRHPRHLKNNKANPDVSHVPPPERDLTGEPSICNQYNGPQIRNACRAYCDVEDCPSTPHTPKCTQLRNDFWQMIPQYQKPGMTPDMLCTSKEEDSTETPTMAPSSSSSPSVSPSNRPSTSSAPSSSPTDPARLKLIAETQDGQEIGYFLIDFDTLDQENYRPTLEFQDFYYFEFASNLDDRTSDTVLYNSDVDPTSSSTVGDLTLTPTACDDDCLDIGLYKMRQADIFFATAANAQGISFQMTIQYTSVSDSDLVFNNRNENTGADDYVIFENVIWSAYYA